MAWDDRTRVYADGPRPLGRPDRAVARRPLDHKNLPPGTALFTTRQEPNEKLRVTSLANFPTVNEVSTFWAVPSIETSPHTYAFSQSRNHIRPRSDHHIGVGLPSGVMGNKKPPPKLSEEEKEAAKVQKANDALQKAAKNDERSKAEDALSKGASVEYVNEVCADSLHANSASPDHVSVVCTHSTEIAPLTWPPPSVLSTSFACCTPKGQTSH